MHEEITLRNMSTEPLPVSLRIGIGGDFADVFEVKEGRVHGDSAGVDGTDRRASTTTRSS